MKPDALLIPPCPRSSRTGAFLITSCMVMLSVTPFFPAAAPAAAAVAVASAAVSALSLQLQAVHAALFTALTAAAPALHPSVREWPFKLLVPVVLYSLAVFAVPRLRQSLTWMRPGRTGREILLPAVAAGLIAGTALLLWVRLLDPDLSVHLGHMPPMPLWLYPAAGLGFAAGNAAVEEFVFRGVVMQAADSAFGPGRLSIALQAWLFGAMHFLRGFPNGARGMAMAVLFGIALGLLRRRARGMLAPWLAHACADLAIFLILAFISAAP